MWHDDPSITPGPSNVPDSSPRARVRVWLWVGFLGVLIGLTSLALALWASSWLVPPYLLLMALILFPPGRGEDTAGLEGPRPQPVPNPEGADDRAKVEGDHQAPAEPVPLAGVSGVPETAPEPEPGPVAAKARRGRGRGRGKATVVVEPPGVTATWVRVGPGKFVRAEIADPTVDESAPAFEAEPNSPQAPVPSATEGLPELDAPVADDLGAPEPRVKAAPVESVAEPELSSFAEAQPPRTPEGVEAAGPSSGSDAPTSLPSADDTPVIAEEVTTLEEPGRSDEPCGADSPPSVEEVTPPLSVESDVSGQHDGPLIPSEDDAVAVTPVIAEEVAEAEEPGSSRDASCGVACGGDGRSTRAEGNQEFEVEKEAAVATEEAPATWRADDPEIRPGVASGDPGLPSEVPVAAWFGEIDVVPPGGVGEGRLASAASSGLPPRSTHLALADSLGRAWRPRARVATSDTGVAPSRHRARSGRGGRVTPGPRRRSPRGAVRSRRSYRTFPPRPPPRELPARWMRGRRRASRSTSRGGPAPCPASLLPSRMDRAPSVSVRPTPSSLPTALFR